MAKTTVSEYEAEPKPDIYLVLLILTFVASLLAIIILFIEKSSLTP